MAPLRIVAPSLTEAGTGPGGKEKGLLGASGDSGTLSWTTRVRLFCLCFIVGTVCSICAACFLWFPKVGLTMFAVFFSLGNVISLASTCFLKGPVKQIKEMFAETRWIAAVVMVVFFTLALMAALWWRQPIVTLIFCVGQSLAMTWYSLSYIPFARTAIKNFFQSTVTQ